MNIRGILQRSETLVGLVRDSRNVSQRFKSAWRGQSPSCAGASYRQYCATHGVRKLHIGAGDGVLPGWLNTDIEPEVDGVVFLDATKPFPFDRNSFDYVFSEHMIEHISRSEASMMLRECQRVLRPGGTIRIATPDLEILAGLYAGKDGDKHHYVKWVTQKLTNGAKDYQPGFVINHAFYSWGHQFLYDGELLARDMEKAGFTSIRRCPMGVSEDEHLRGIESHGRLIEDDRIAAFETMVLEGECAKES